MPSSWGGIEKGRKASEGQPSLPGLFGLVWSFPTLKRLGYCQRSLKAPIAQEIKILSASVCIALGLCGLATSRDWFREDFHAKARRRQDDWQKGIDRQVEAAKPHAEFAGWN